MFEFLWWQQALLTVVFVTDLIVFANLARGELNDWRFMHRRKTVPPKDGHPAH